jgi:D-hexose-6-phosphate mutarotase
MSTGTLIEALNREFGTGQAVRFEPGQGGLTCALITTPQATARVYLHGAHVTHYRPHGQEEMLFVSECSHFEPGKPIRGGIPICFPWFGDAAKPAHGFARLAEWSVDRVDTAADGSVTLTLLKSTADPGHDRTLWPFDALLRHHVRVSDDLQLSLAVTNIGNQPLTYEEALHTYFAVSDVRQVRVSGLGGATYLDKTQQYQAVQQSAEPLTLHGETDQIYLNTRATCVIDDPQEGRGGRQITVAKEGSDATVLWNPWIEKARSMADFGDEEWRRMLCIETANVRDHSVRLAGGETHVLRARLGCRNMNSPGANSVEMHPRRG